MIVKTYGIYDTKAEEFVRTFTSQNDETAKRAAEYIVRDKGFDKRAGKDMVIQYLYSFDTATGVVVDNQIHLVANLASFIEDFEMELKAEAWSLDKLKEQRMFLDQAIANAKAAKEATKAKNNKGDNKNAC